jgi:hypothetical protein
MKNAPTTISSESAPDKCDYTPGTLPKRINTVTVSVLASLLESNVLTGMESVFKESTTRLSAVVHRLERTYDWHVERRDITTGTNDGRIARITAYWLPQATIEQAFKFGALAWVNDVKAARAKQRQQAKQCKLEAVRLNAARKQCKIQDTHQGRLWGDV